MRVVIAGGHGKIALRLAAILAARGDGVVGLIRNPDQAGDLRSVAAVPAICDLEVATAGQVAVHLAGADAVVFAAGAGPGSGIARKDTVDRAAAGLLADAAQQVGVRRYLLISAMGVDTSPALRAGEVFRAYLRAKWVAEEDLRARDLDWTVLRPGRLTGEPGRGRVRLGRRVWHGSVSRDDVAAVLAALLDAPATVGQTLEVVGGDIDVDRAVAAVARAGQR